MQKMKAPAALQLSTTKTTESDSDRSCAIEGAIVFAVGAAAGVALFTSRYSVALIALSPDDALLWLTATANITPEVALARAPEVVYSRVCMYSLLACTRANYSLLACTRANCSFHLRISQFCGPDASLIEGSIQKSDRTSTVESQEK